VNRSPSNVLDVLWEEDNFIATLPSVTKAKLLRQTPSQKELECTEKFLGFELTYVMVMRKDDKAGLIRFREKAGADNVFGGSLSARPLPGGRATVTYATFGEAPWYIPDSVIKSTIEDMGPEIAARTQRLCREKTPLPTATLK